MLNGGLIYLKEFENVKKQFQDQGINIFAYKPYYVNPNNEDEEIGYAMKATKALGGTMLL